MTKKQQTLVVVGVFFVGLFLASTWALLFVSSFSLLALAGCMIGFITGMFSCYLLQRQAKGAQLYPNQPRRALLNGWQFASLGLIFGIVIAGVLRFFTPIEVRNFLAIIIMTLLAVQTTYEIFAFYRKAK